eukprot:335523-Alexandrium_andersonii.AAC.1
MASSSQLAPLPDSSGASSTVRRKSSTSAMTTCTRSRPPSPQRPSSRPQRPLCQPLRCAPCARAPPGAW